MKECNFDSDLAAYEVKQACLEKFKEEAEGYAKTAALEYLSTIHEFEIIEAMNENDDKELNEMLERGFETRNVSMIGTAVWRMCYFYQKSIKLDEIMDASR